MAPGEPLGRGTSAGGRREPPASARLVRSLERWFESRRAPTWLLDPDDPRRIARSFQVAVFLGGVGAVLAVLLGGGGLYVRVALAVAVAAVFTLMVAATGVESLPRRRFGPAPALASGWFVGTAMLETLLNGWTGDGTLELVLQTVLALAMAVVAWGKVRLALHEA